MDDQPKRIGIFGGTFNPVHNGHISIAKAFLEDGSIDALWIFLNPAPPHKNNKPFAPYMIRMHMLYQAFNPIEGTVVSDLETELPAPSYTIQTVSFLKDSYPGYTFFLCIGKDSYQSFKTWHKWQDILKLCRLLVADRPLKEEEIIDPELSAYTHFIEHEPVNISSTKVRNKVEKKESITALVPAPVAETINRERLYTE